MLAYKLLSKKKDGSIGPLFINVKQRLKIGEWVNAENHPTKGYTVRQGWHTLATQEAPHLSKKGRVWCLVEIDQYEEMKRPLNQGGIWYLAQKMRVIEELK